jgi:hypothetical protein
VTLTIGPYALEAWLAGYQCVYCAVERANSAEANRISRSLIANSTRVANVLNEVIQLRNSRLF